MPQRDYILALIEQMARVLARIRERILGDDTGASLEMLRAELRDVIARSGIDLDMAVQVDPGTLLTLLSLGGVLDVAKAVLVADVLAVEALRRERLQPAEAETARRLRGKALALYRAARPLVTGGDAESIDTRIAQIQEDEAP